MATSSLCRTLVYALACLLAAVSAAAQTNTGQISGTVRDAQGGVLPGVSVTITNVNTGLTWTDVTDENGFYSVTNLPVGAYSVGAELQGFRKAEKTGFDLSSDARITADFGLEVGGLAETVQVEAVLGEVGPPARSLAPLTATRSANSRCRAATISSWHPSFPAPCRRRTIRWIRRRA